MQATIIDLRYHMKDVLHALSRNEKVTVLYHGKPKAIIMPIKETNSTLKVSEHPYFGSSRKHKESVKELMNKLRGDRYGDL